MKTAPEIIHLQTKYINEDVRLIWRRYAEGGRVRLDFLSLEGEPMMTATVNLPDEPLADDEAFIKSYSEGEGLLAGLLEAELIYLTPRAVRSGHVIIPVIKWAVALPEIEQ